MRCSAHVPHVLHLENELTILLSMSIGVFVGLELCVVRELPF